MTETPPRDLLARPLRDLRISVTDRCNFRCTYCMPSEVFGPGFEFLPHREVLTFEEIARLAQVFVGLGVEKVRVTGGEPLLRRDLPRLIEQLAAIPGLADLTLTTNGALLPRLAAPLAAAGLRRVTVSLDALDDGVFRRITDTASISVTQVLAGIEAASRAGLAPVKVNAVIVRGVNEDQIVPLAERFRGSGHILRFIEFMDVGASNGWRMDQVVPAREILERLGAVYPIAPLAPNYGGEVAERWRYCDGGGEVGVIASVTQPFCGGCTRARLSADGQFFTCLFATHGHALKRPLRDGCSDEQLGAAIAEFWSGRDDRYSELRARSTPGYATMRKIEMSYIGG